MKTLASDNYSGVHPEIMEALVKANAGHAPSYGSDEYTERAVQKFKSHFGDDIEVFFVYNGTGANVLGLSALTSSYHSILCSEQAHIVLDESTAPEKFTGCRLITIPVKNGMITAEQVEEKIQRMGDPHHPQAKVVSITQSTEYGTVYTTEEIKSIALVARKYGLYMHMDGSRISNAAVSLGQDFRSFTRDAGVDVLSFGGTKNGLMFGEAIIFFRQELADNFKYIRKQGMHLHSKMRFIGAQFEALLSNELWKRNAAHANNMARLLERELLKIPQVKINQPVQSNGVFAFLPGAIIEKVQKEVAFYVWDDKTLEVRLMCSFDTTEDDIRRLTDAIRKAVA